MPPAHAFLATYGGGHARIGAAVAKEWNRRGYQCTVLALTTAGAIYEASGIPFLGMKDCEECTTPEALVWGQRLTEGMTPHPDVPGGESEAYFGTGMVDLIADKGESAARLAFAAQGRMAFHPQRSIERILRRLKPEIVMTTNSPRAEMATLSAARELGIPSVVVTDLFVEPEIDRLGNPEYANRSCVLAESERKKLIESGWNPDHVVVTGNPAFDTLALPSVKEAGNRWRKSLGHEGPVILWASQPDPCRPDTSYRVACALADAGAANGWRIVWRPHPNEEVVDPPKGVTISHRDDPLEPILYGVDAVVVVSSTVGLQAALAKSKVIQLDIPVSFQMTPYTEMGIAERADGPGDLARAIHFALGSQKSNGSQLPPCGTSAARVADTMESLLKG
ncbi:MAG: hypothetical protein KF812_06560 [Fimbriimonadaceae bacterium]|nr:hypothetical protein [Fimbriimonadaceae bacterium]